METREDIVRERAKERLASMDREQLGEMSIEEVKNTYNRYVEEESVREDNIRLQAQEKLASMDTETLNEMTIEEVKDTYNDIKDQIRKESMEDMFKEESSDDSVKTK